MLMSRTTTLFSSMLAVMTLAGAQAFAEFQKTVNDVLRFGKTNFAVVEDFKSMQAGMEASGFMMFRNFEEVQEFQGPVMGKTEEAHTMKKGIYIPLSAELGHYTVKQYRAVVDYYAKQFGAPHVFADERDEFTKFTYSFWQFKTGILLVRMQNGFDIEQKLAKEIAKTNPEDPRIRYDKLNDVYFLTEAGVDANIEAIYGGAAIFYLTPAGIDDMKVLPKEPLELGQAEAFFKKLTTATMAGGLAADREPVGEIPEKIAKNALFDVANQKVACYYKAQKFYADEACTELLYFHNGSAVGDKPQIAYGEGLFRFASGRMYKGNSYDVKDVVASIAEIRSKRGDTLEAKIYKGCVFVRDLEKVDNDNGEDVYKFHVSYDNIKRAEIPALFTYKDGKLYRGDETEDRDCVMVIDPALNASRILFAAMTFAKQYEVAVPVAAPIDQEKKEEKKAEEVKEQPAAPAPAAEVAPAAEAAPAAAPAPAPAEEAAPAEEKPEVVKEVEQTTDKVKSGLKSLKKFF